MAAESRISVGGGGCMAWSVGHCIASEFNAGSHLHHGVERDFESRYPRVSYCVEDTDVR